MAGFAALLGLAYEVGPAQWLDAAALDGFATLGDAPRVFAAANDVAHAFDPEPYAVFTGAVLLFALLARKFRQAVAAAVLIAGANVSSQLLKPALAHPREVDGWNHVHELQAAAFPSGHATAAMAVALAAVLVAPHAWRPLTALVSGAAVLVVSICLVVLNWHFPSDVVGGHLLATTWCLVALAGLSFANRRWPAGGDVRRAAREAMTRRRAAVQIALGLLALAFVVGIAASRADWLTDYAHDHTAAVAVGAAIAASATALLAAVTALAARRN